MLSDYDLFVAEVLDEPEFFKRLVRFASGLDPTLALWGKPPEEVLAGLSAFAAPVSALRKFFFRERTYRFTKKNTEAFLAACRDLDFTKVTWGLFVDGTSLVRSKAYGRIGVCSGKRAPSHKVRDLMNSLDENAIIKSYKFLEGELKG